MIEHKIPHKRERDEQYHKGDGENTRNSEEYFFIKIPEYKEAIDKIVSEYNDKKGNVNRIEHVTTTDMIDLYKKINFTSEAIKSYIRGIFEGVKMNGPSLFTDKDGLYLIKLRRSSPQQDKIIVFDDRGNESFIHECMLDNTDNEFLRNVQAITARHHIVEADTYLKYIHENTDYNFNDNISWARGNLLLGPNPDINYHDGTKAADGIENHLPRANNNKLTKEKAEIELPKDQNSNIEAWVFDIPATSKAKKNLESIKKCANAYTGLVNTNAAIELSREATTAEPRLNLEKKKVIREFCENWLALMKSPMLTGLWVPSPNSPKKLECKLLFTLGEHQSPYDNIMQKLQSLIRHQESA